jgi:hypothetical protein
VTKTRYQLARFWIQTYHWKAFFMHAAKSYGAKLVLLSCILLQRFKTNQNRATCAQDHPSLLVVLPLRLLNSSQIVLKSIDLFAAASRGTPLHGQTSAQHRLGLPLSSPQPYKRVYTLYTCKPYNLRIWPVPTLLTEACMVLQDGSTRLFRGLSLQCS